MKFNTKLLHGKASGPYERGATLPPVSQVNAFAYETAEELEKVFQNRAPGFSYSRIGNPVVQAFEAKVSEMEGGKGAIACSSGMSAVTLSLLNILETGDELIAGSSLFGGTIDLLHDIERFGIVVHYVARVDISHVEPLLNDKTKVVFGEVIGNPSLDVIDIKKMADFLHEKGIPLILDSTTATPYLVRPFELGADIVVHSTSKYINGTANSISGIIVDGGSFPWNFERYPCLAAYKRYGKFAYMARLRNDLWRNIGGCMSPMNAWLNIQGLETLGLRMERICDNAKGLAEALQETGIDVNYPTLPDHPDAELVKEQLGGKGGGILTIRAGSRERAYKLMNSLRYAFNATNIGDVNTLVIHPASTIYIHNTVEEKEAAGVYDDTIRISVGIEDVEDLIEDFKSAIAGLDD